MTVGKGFSSKSGNLYVHSNLTRCLQGEKNINFIHRSEVLTPVFGKMNVFNVLKKIKRDSEKVSIFSFEFQRCPWIAKYLIIPGSQPLEILTSAIGEWSVRQGT